MSPSRLPNVGLARSERVHAALAAVAHGSPRPGPAGSRAGELWHRGWGAGAGAAARGAAAAGAGAAEHPIEGGAAELAEARCGIVLPAAAPARRRVRSSARPQGAERASGRPCGCAGGSQIRPTRRRHGRAGRGTVRCEVEPQVRQNCMFLAFSAPQRGQRAGLGRGAAWTAPRRPFWPAIGAPQAWQNAFCGGFSRWHWRQIMRRSVEPPATAASRSQRALHTLDPVALATKIRGRQRGWTRKNGRASMHGLNSSTHRSETGTVLGDDHPCRPALAGCVRSQSTPARRRCAQFALDAGSPTKTC